MAKNKMNQGQGAKAGKNYTVPNMMDEFATEYDTDVKKDKDIPISTGTTKTQQTKSGVEKVLDTDKDNTRRTT